MSEEEKKAIEILKVVNDTKYTCHYYTIEDLKAIDTILKLVENQQKEIEELKKDKKALVKNYDKVLGTFISKDKIREKIKELENKIDGDDYGNTQNIII